MPDLLTAATSTAPTPPVRRLSKAQQHIKAVIEERLADGTYKPGEKLPSARRLAEEFGVGETPVYWALQPFRESGALQAVPGRGHIVTDPTTTTPIATSGLEIQKTLRARLLDGTYAVGTWLPSNAELAAEFKVMRSTIQRVLTLLRKERLLTTVASLGTYAVDPNQPEMPAPSTPPVDVKRLRKTLRARLRDGTYPPGTQLPSLNELSNEFGVGPHTVTAALTHLRTDGHLITPPGSSRLFAKPANTRVGKSDAP